MMSTVLNDNEEKPSRNTSTVMPRAMEIGVPVISNSNRMLMMSRKVMAAPPRMFTLCRVAVQLTGLHEQHSTCMKR